MKKARGLLRFIFILTTLSLAAGTPPTEYRLFFAKATLPSGPARIVLRSFRQNGERCFLLVDPHTLATSILPAQGIKVVKEPLAACRREFGTSVYARVMAEAERNAKKLVDAGITHSLPEERGIILTIDLCPSRKPLDHFLFQDILAAFERVERPVPLAIALSGLWMEEHPDDLRWLASLVKSGRATIDWINHSYHHQHDSRLPLRKNFLLEKGINLEQEVLRTEQKMIACGIIPSIFFRFPGLVSDSSEFKRVLALGLAPVGSDAWLAKSQRPGPGSIVLIHGNGNEPLGIKKFLVLVKRERKEIKKKNWLLLDLRDSLARDD